MDQQMFTVFQGRFDKLESLLAAHAEKDDEVHKIVERHETYVKVIKWLGAPALLGLIGSIVAKAAH